MHKQHKTELVATPAPESLVFVSSHDKRVQLYLIGNPIEALQDVTGQSKTQWVSLIDGH